MTPTHQNYSRHFCLCNMHVIGSFRKRKKKLRLLNWILSVQKMFSTENNEYSTELSFGHVFFLFLVLRSVTSFVVCSRVFVVVLRPLIVCVIPLSISTTISAAYFFIFLDMFHDYLRKSWLRQLHILYWFMKRYRDWAFDSNDNDRIVQIQGTDLWR